ncbi:hypothetical protein AAY473_012425 [Plecturocebus cupreus]
MRPSQKKGKPRDRDEETSWERSVRDTRASLTSSVLYMPMPTPPAGKLYTSHSLTPLPSFGVNTILNVPARSATKSVALYCRDERTARPGALVGGCPGGPPSPTLAYLVTVGMPANGDGLGPARDEAWDVFADDGLPEDGPPQDVPDSSIGTFPHLLQLELCEDREKVAPLQPPPFNQNLNFKQQHSQPGVLKLFVGESVESRGKHVGSGVCRF